MADTRSLLAIVAPGLQRSSAGLFGPWSRNSTIATTSLRRAARADLSFVERTVFADKLDTLDFDRETIMSAISADKTTVSKMLSVTKRIPAEGLSAIGAAKTTRRDRWHDLSIKF